MFGADPTLTAFNAADIVAAVYQTLTAGVSRAVLLIRAQEEIPADGENPAAGEIRRERVTHKAVLRRLATDRLGDRIDMVLDHLDAATDFYFDDISQIRMDSWSRGPVTLVGDAGYGPGPAVGGGTSLAVAGAYILAAELATCGRGGVEEALRRYGAALADPVRHGHRVAPATFGSLVPRNEFQVRLTAGVTRLLPHLPATVRRRLTSFGGGPAAMLDSLRLASPAAR